MLRFKLRNTFLKSRTEENRNNYSKQTNLLYFCKKVRENNLEMLMRKTVVIIRNLERSETPVIK